MAGAPFFFGEGEAEGLGDSLASGEALGPGDADGDSSGDGDGVGELFRFFFLPGLGDESGEGLGDDFFFFGEGEAFGSGVSDGLGVAEDFFFLSVGDFSGEALGFGVGDFSAVDFFFFRGAGVGVGAKIFFNLVPSDSSAGARWTTVASNAKTRKATAVLIVRRIAVALGTIFSPARRAQPC